MGIKIVIPEGDGIKSTRGIKVYTDDGHEINHVSRIEIDWTADCILTASITVAVEEIENLQGIEGIIIAENPDDPKESLSEITKKFCS